MSENPLTSSNPIYGLLKNNQNIVSIKKLPFIIGRKENSDLQINNPSISKKHAFIQFDQNNSMNNECEGLILVDNSLNGTYINGTKITNGKKMLLETGDKISFGNDKTIYIFELMNYDQDKTIVYPSLLGYNGIQSSPISLVNFDNYQTSHIDHFNTQNNFLMPNNNFENNTFNHFSNTQNNNDKLFDTIKNNTKREIKNDDNEEIIKNEEKQEKSVEIKENEQNKKNLEILEKIDEMKKFQETTENNDKKIFSDLEENNKNISSLKNEISQLKEENLKFQNEISKYIKIIQENQLKNNVIEEKKVQTEENEKYKNVLITEHNVNNKNENKNVFINENNEINMDLLLNDMRELGLFRRIKENLIPNYENLSFEELSMEFDKIISEYKNKFNTEEILLNMENEYNIQINNFNNIIEIQETQKKKLFNKLNDLFILQDKNDKNEKNVNNKDNAIKEKANKYLKEQLNELMDEKETNIKIINQLKGDIIKLNTEISLYKNQNSYLNNLNDIKKHYQNKLSNPKNNRKEIKNQTNIIKNKIDNIQEQLLYLSLNNTRRNFRNNSELKTKSERFSNRNKNLFFERDNEKRNKIEAEKNLEREKNNGLLEDYKKLNILLENSIENKKYKEICQQKEKIISGNLW